MENVQRQVLVVDSSASHLFYMAMLLKKMGYRVRTATTAENALQLIADSAPSLVITDTALAPMTGLNLLKTMKRSASLKPIPVFMHTDQTEIAVRDACTLAGCTGYFVKPVAPDFLYRAMQAATEAAPRKTIRIETLLKARVTGGPGGDSGMRTEEVTSLSEGGLYIQSSLPEPVKNVISLTLFIGAREIKARAVVLYSSAKAGGPHKTPGMGVRFEDISAEDKAVIAGFIKEQVTKELSAIKG